MMNFIYIMLAKAGSWIDLGVSQIQVLSQENLRRVV